jgi:hypothetical protein
LDFISGFYFTAGAGDCFDLTSDSFGLIPGLGDYSEILVSFLGCGTTTGSLFFTSGFGDYSEISRGVCFTGFKTDYFFEGSTFFGSYFLVSTFLGSSPLVITLTSALDLSIKETAFKSALGVAIGSSFLGPDFRDTTEVLSGEASSC